MSNTKKQYVELVAFLEANKNKKVSTILDEVLEMCVAKKGGSNGKTFMTNEAGEVTHVYCWYHKEWEDVTVAEYGAKKGTASGLNTMCKQGVSSWTKAQRLAKQAESNMLNSVVAGEVEASEIPTLRAEIEATRTTIVAREDGHKVEF